MPNWAIVLIVLSIVGFIGILVIGLLAAIAIPNFVKARNTAQMNACINNLSQIDGAKQQWALETKSEATDTPTQAELVPYFKDGQFLICPAKGTYTINAVGEAPVCTVSRAARHLETDDSWLPEERFTRTNPSAAAGQVV